MTAGVKSQENKFRRHHFGSLITAGVRKLRKSFNSSLELHRSTDNTQPRNLPFAVKVQKMGEKHELRCTQENSFFKNRTPSRKKIERKKL